MDELEKTAQETAEETGGMAPDAGEQQVPAGEQGVPGGEEDFETLIRGRYKGEFDARVRRILDGRLRGLRQENERLREMAAAAETARQREQEAAAGRDGIRGDPGAAADGPGHRQRRQPRGGERRTAQERQPLGPEGAQRCGAGGDTEESTGWRKDQVLERERKHGDEFADVCGEHPDHGEPERGDEDLLWHGAAGERQTAAGAQPVRGHEGPACRRRQDRGVA